MALRVQITPSMFLQTELTAIYPFFATHHSYGYALSQENGYLTHQLPFSNNNEGVT